MKFFEQKKLDDLNLSSFRDRWKFFHQMGSARSRNRVMGPMDFDEVVSRRIYCMCNICGQTQLGVFGFQPSKTRPEPQQ